MSSVYQTAIRKRPIILACISNGSVKCVKCSREGYPPLAPSHTKVLHVSVSDMLKYVFNMYYNFYSSDVLGYIGDTIGGHYSIFW